MPIAKKTIQKGALNGKNGLLKAYNMAILDDDSAEINMYGDVLMQAPRDYWTGEKIKGTYIAADEFLEDLEEIKDKSNITVYINSGGGDLYAGLAIYNRLKTLKGHITTINDGIVASAASIIFQAGDVRKMNSASNFMAHGVGSFMFGFYMLDDLEEAVTQFKAHNKAVVNVYAERMGVSFKEAEKFVKGETWLTGQEAIDKGLADELIEQEEDEEAEDGLLNSLIGKITSIYANPMNRAIPAAAPQVANNKKDGGKKMAKTINELREQYPELVAQIENSAAENGKKEGQKEERKRIKDIEEIADGILDKEMITNAKFGEKTMTAAELSLAVMKQQASIGASMLKSLEEDAQASGAAQVKASPKSAEEDDEEKKKEKEEEEEKEVDALANIANAARGGKR